MKNIMPTQILAKMKSWNDPQKQGNSELVRLNAVYAEHGVNEAWATSTPSGTLSLTIDNPNAQGFFKRDVEYLISIREATPGE